MKNGSKEKTAKNEILSLLSILSIVLVFAAICGSILALLLQVGAMKLPGFLSRKEISDEPSPAKDDTLSLLHKKNGSGKEMYLSEADGDALKRLIVGIVSSDIAYMRISCVKISENESQTGIFDIWRYGEKYRVVEYDVGGAQKYDIVYNGEYLVMITSDDEERKLDGLGYYDISPMPDISSVFSESCNVIYANSEYDEFEAIFDDNEKNEVFDIKISMSEMRPISIKQFQDNSPNLIIEVLLFSENVDENTFLQ